MPDALSVALAKKNAVQNARAYGHDPGPWREGETHPGAWFADCRVSSCYAMLAVRMWDSPPHALFTGKPGAYECPAPPPPNLRDR